MTAAPDLVLDSSATLPWVFEDETTRYTEDLLDSMPHVVALIPSLYFWEVANVLAGAVKRGRILEARAKAFMGELDAFAFEVVSPVAFGEVDEVYAAARTHDLTVYDAQYLCLAAARGLPLATLDHALLAAMTTLGIARYEP